MLHGVSLKHVDNSFIQRAIHEKADPNTIVKLKAQVAFSCITGFEYHEETFENLSNLLKYDVAFNNFRFAEEKDATYNREKHLNAKGLIRGVDNIISGCSWIWFDIDVTDITDIEMHLILSGVNHHIARTSNPAKSCKYRVLVELDKSIKITRAEWKPFLQSMATYLGLGKIDKLAMSQIAFGYEGREVLTTLGEATVDPIPHLKAAQVIVARQEEEEAEMLEMLPEGTKAALDSPFNTFEFAFNAQEGDRWKTSMAAIALAKKLGADKKYIQDLMYKINDFLDVPKSHEVVRISLFSAI